MTPDTASPFAPVPRPRPRSPMAPPQGLQVADIADYLAKFGLIPTPAASAEQLAAEKAAQERRQKLLVGLLIAAVVLVHLLWLAKLVAVFGCGGSFLDRFLPPEDDAGTVDRRFPDPGSLARYLEGRRLDIGFGCGRPQI